MKQIAAVFHHVRTTAVVQALRDAGYQNITLQDVKGMLQPLSESEEDFSRTTGGSMVISEVRLSLVCEDEEVERIATIIRAVGRIGPTISGWVYVGPIEQVLPIGGARPVGENK